MSKRPRVSVIIPSFNREATLKQSVASVLRQTYEEFELIVVDDCSDDRTSEVLSQICDSRMKVITHDRNRGGSAARNTGIRAAQAEYVAFQDSDDEWLPTKLQKQMAVLENAGPTTIGVYCGMLVLGTVMGDPADSVGVRYLPAPDIPVPLEGNIHASLLRARSFISTQTFVVRRDLLIRSGGFDESLKALQDWDCFIRVAAHGQISFVKEPLVLQRFSANSLTRSTRNRVLAMSVILEKYEEDFRKIPRTLSQHYDVLAGGYRRLGEFSTAAKYYFRSLRLYPSRLGVWLKVAYTLVQHAYRAIADRQGAIDKKKSRYG
jgi:glycosyltransferase involved in cell wall biosynthesis